MNVWKCAACSETVSGFGRALGLRALGWQIEIHGSGSLSSPTILCPRHRTDGIDPALAAAAAQEKIELFYLATAARVDGDCPECAARRGEDCWIEMGALGGLIGKVTTVDGVWTHAARVAIALPTALPTAGGGGAPGETTFTAGPKGPPRE